MRILDVEDDRKVAGFVQRGLAPDGFVVDVLFDGHEAAERVAALDYDAVVLDLMLPGGSGFVVLRQIRSRRPGLLVLILTARDALEDRVAGLDTGADDYMVKPFAIAELAARLRALLRRGVPREPVLRVGGLELDTIKRTARRAGRSIDLTRKEYALLEYLMRHAGRPVTRSLLIDRIWGPHFESLSNVVEVHVNSLRAKVDRGFPVALIHTVRGTGYMVSETPP
jgi:two-component system copper resistance phosphate regulon response regulator CusR